MQCLPSKQHTTLKYKTFSFPITSLVKLYKHFSIESVRLYTSTDREEIVVQKILIAQQLFIPDIGFQLYAACFFIQIGATLKLTHYIHYLTSDIKYEVSER